MYSIASTTVRRSSACLRPRLPGALNTDSSSSHWSSVRSLGYDMRGTVPTVTTRAIGTHPVRSDLRFTCRLLLVGLRTVQRAGSCGTVRNAALRKTRPTPEGGHLSKTSLLAVAALSSLCSLAGCGQSDKPATS